MGARHDDSMVLHRIRREIHYSSDSMTRELGVIRPHAQSVQDQNCRVLSGTRLRWARRSPRGATSGEKPGAKGEHASLQPEGR